VLPFAISQDNGITSARKTKVLLVENQRHHDRLYLNNGSLISCNNSYGLERIRLRNWLDRKHDI